MRTALILGAGIFGLSAAWALARAGFAVRLIDQDDIPNPRGSSVDDHRLIRDAYGAALGYMRMVAPAQAAWELLFAEAGERLLVPTGVLALAAGPGGWLADSRAALRAAGRPVQDLGGAAVAARWPFLSPSGIADAFHLPQGGVLLARRIVAALAGLLARRGVAIERGRAVGLDPVRGALTLDGGAQRQADLLVVAAGAWAPRLVPGLAGRVRPSRQIVVRLAPPPELAEAWARAPMLLDLAGDGGFYAVPPVAGTPLKIGDHRFAPEGDPEDDPEGDPAGDPRAATPEEAEAILALARPRLPGLDRYRLLSAAACYYDLAAEERFLVEPLGPRALVLAGFSGHGFKFGPLIGLAVARAAADPALASLLPGWAAGRTEPPACLLADLVQDPCA